jgi:hypothetical protein
MTSLKKSIAKDYEYKKGVSDEEFIPFCNERNFKGDLITSPSK